MKLNPFFLFVLHDGTLCYGDLLEGQLGDVLHFPECVDISVFGSKTDPSSAGQPTSLPTSSAPNKGAVSMVCSAQRGMERLLSRPPATLEGLGARMVLTLGRAERAGPEALATLPQPIMASPP